MATAKNEAKLDTVLYTAEAAESAAKAQQDSEVEDPADGKAALASLLKAKPDGRPGDNVAK